MTKIRKSIVATGGSTISETKNDSSKKSNQLKVKYTIIGFLLGIISSLIATFIYDYLA